jgi:3D (Asp-Asp-Asp) domain-containing protein
MNTSFILCFILIFLPYEIENYNKKINEAISPVTPIIVTATTYRPTEEETDTTPNITASGFKIDLNNPKRHKIIAVSRDLKRKWPFGSKVYIKGVGKHDGIYVVRDVMNKRYKKRIDILIGHQDKQITYKKVKAFKLN